MTEPLQKSNQASFSTLVLGAIGVVYGDIGTSPLYTLKSVFGGSHSPMVNEMSILGILSIIFWSLIIVVSLKYIVFVMRADNHGEGGIMALTALALRRFPKDQSRYLLIMALGILGAGLFYGDSVITPAISVLSAIEGLKVAEPNLHHMVIPATVIVLYLLFHFQFKGTGFIGRFFGIVMVIWFLTIAIIGIVSISGNPGVLRALNPSYAVEFFATNRLVGFIALGATFLALTGAEALYADMGHFGLKPIRVSWFYFIFPALVLNYFGQGALLLKNPAAISQPFYLLSPTWFLYPFILLATAATIIASQAVISGTFSMTQAAIRLGYLPRLEIQYTSEEKKGQIYLPAINWILFAVIISIVLGFKTSDNLAAAYGLSVTGTMVITTILAFGVIAHLWKIEWWKIAPVFGIFFLIDFSFLGANSIKILEGGWLPLLIAGIMFIIMTTWRKGSALLKRRIADQSVSVDTFVKKISESAPMRVPGTGIFMTPSLTAIPPALFNNLIHNKVLQERVALLKVDIEDMPHLPQEERVEIKEVVKDSLYTLHIRFGFKDDIDVPEALKQFQMDETTFFIGHIKLLCSNAIEMARWRKRLFIWLFNNSSNFIDYCKIPPKLIVELGTSVEL